jgi:YebC/PmpR family DNA-binding regulatory protein
VLADVFDFLKNKYWFFGRFAFQWCGCRASRPPKFSTNLLIMGRAFECRRRAKEARWDKMSKVFPKMAKLITMAAKEGGPDPMTNAKLRLAISNAKAENLPKDNIDAAIKRAAAKDAQDIVEVNYEGKGPHGVLVFVECATDNSNRSVTNVKTYFNKNGGQMVPSGSLEFLFSRKTAVEFQLIPGMDLEEIELALIDGGLEELEVEDDLVTAYADYASFSTLTQAFEQLGIEVKKAELRRIASNPVELTEEQLEEVEKLIDKIEDDDDVQAVYTNIA